MSGSLGTWLQLFGLLALEGAVVFGIAAQMQRLTQSAAWRRMIWQGCVLSLLLLAVFELSGMARDWSGWMKEMIRPVSVAGISPGQKVSSAGNVGKTQERLSPQTMAENVAAGVRPAVEPGVSPGGNAGSAEKIFGAQKEFEKGPGGRMPPSTAGGTPAATARFASRKNFDWLWAAVPGLVWLLGGAVVLGRMLVARIAFEIFRWRRREVKDGELREMVGKLALRLGIRRRVRLLESDEICGPVAFGILRPTIALPTGFKFSPAQREAMLAHELAHLAGHDAGWYLLADFLTVALWWHPLVWRARWQLHAASELAADEASLLVANGPGVLAECLVEMGTRLTQRRVLRQMGVAGNGFRSCLGRRVERLVKLEGNSWRPPNRIGGGLARVLGPMSLVAAIILCSAWVIPQATNKGEKGDNMKTMTETWKKPLAAIALLASLNSGVVAGPSATIAADKNNSTDYYGTHAGEYAPAGASGGFVVWQDNITDGDGRGISAVRLDSTAASLAAASANPMASTTSATSAASDAIDPRKTGNHAMSATSSSLLPVNNFAQANSGQTRTAEQGAVETKLYNITVDSVQYDNLPLTEVINNLVELAVSKDPEKRGINFVLNREKPDAVSSGVVDPTTGLPVAAAEPLDLNNVDVTIKPPLRHVRLIDVLEVMVKCADKPIKYSIENYGVVISQDMSKASAAPPQAAGVAPEPLTVMTFKVDTNTFFAGLERTFSISFDHPNPRSVADGLKSLMNKLGIESDNPQKSIFYNDVTGMVMMRGTSQDISLMSAAIETLGGSATKSIAARP